MTVVQTSCIQVLVLGVHNSHMYMIFQFRYVASRKEMRYQTDFGNKTLEHLSYLRNWNPKTGT